MPDTRASLSKKNPYWVSKHRYYELKHFCLQYDEWTTELNSLDGFGMSMYAQPRVDRSPAESAVERLAEKREDLLRMKRLVEDAAAIAVGDIFSGAQGLLLLAVTKGVSYDKLRATVGVPFCRDTFYDIYRRFFW